MNTPMQSLRDQAQKSFERDLPRLLDEHPGEWVAYRGERQVACAAHTQEVYETCFRLGLQPDQFVIFEIAPPDEEIAFTHRPFRE